MPYKGQESRVSARGRRSARRLAAIAVLGLALPLGACNELLSVENPGAIQDGQLNDPILGKTIVQSVVSDFQRMYGDLAYYILEPPTWPPRSAVAGGKRTGSAATS